MKTSWSSHRQYAHTALVLSELRFQGLTYSEVNLDNFEGLRKEVVMETGHGRSLLFSICEETPPYSWGSDNLLEYL